MAFITPFVSRQYAGVYPIKSPMEPRHSPEKQRIVINDLSAPSIEKLVESPSSSRRSSQRSDRSSRADSITELRREIAAAKPRPRTGNCFNNILTLRKMFEMSSNKICREAVSFALVNRECPRLFARKPFIHYLPLSSPLSVRLESICFFSTTNFWLVVFSSSKRERENGRGGKSPFSSPPPLRSSSSSSLFVQIVPLSCLILPLAMGCWRLHSSTLSEGKSLDTLVAEKDQRLAELKRRKQQNIRRRHTMTLRKISEQYETSQTIREDDLIFDQNENGFTTLEKLAEAEEEEKAKKEAAAEKRRHPVRRRFSKFFRWLCNFRS